MPAPALFRFWLLLVLVLSAAPSAAAQEFWEKKDFTQWTEKECRRLLEDSPWARQFTISTSFIQEILREPAGALGRETNPKITYTAQLRSALPVRRALVRLQQFAQKYETLEPVDKQAFDIQASKYLDTKFPDSVVILIEFNSNVQPYASELDLYWKRYTEDQARNDIFLVTPAGQRLKLSRFVLQPQGAGFHLVFPRLVNGEPITAGGKGELHIELPHPNIGNLGAHRVLLSFAVAKLAAEGALQY